MKRKTIHRIFAIIVVLGVFLNIQNQKGSTVSASDKLADRYLISDNQTQDEEAEYYKNYLAEGVKNGWKDATSSVDVDLTTVKSENSLLKPSAQKSISWANSNCSYAEFSFDVEAEGYYNLQVEYQAIKGTMEAPRRWIKIDGKTQYSEMKNIVFSRIWKDAGKPKTNALGDMIRPKQVEVFEKQTVLVSDYLGRYAEPLKFYLTKGKHTIRFTYIGEPMEIFGIRFVAPKSYPDYSQVLKEYKEKGYTNSSDTIKINAEEPYQKSDSSLRLEFTGDPMADPATDGSYILNAMGGERWNKGNQTISYRFVVKKAGLYKIGLRAYQKYNDGLDSYRQIAIDGEVPFKELLNYKFAYSDWKNVVLEDKAKNPYLFYLSEGEHRLDISVKTATYTDILINLEESLNNLSKVIRGVIKITSISPDPNFDYELDKKLPWLEGTLQQISSGLGEQIKSLRAKSEKNPGPVNSLAEIKFKIDKMIKDPFIIAKNLTSLIDSQTTLSSWIKSFNNSPLMLDYIEIANPDAKLERGRSNFFQVIGITFKSFVQSFFKEYDNISGVKNTDGEKKLNVWVSRGKEWGEILKQISDEEFTGETGVSVNMNILPAGQLGTGGVMLLAVASGTAPDIVIGSDMNTPAEYGMRGVLVDLSKQPGYSEISKRFLEGVKTPYIFNDQVYALPETMDFSIMYYRKDILSELNIALPQTWEELYQKVLPVLKRNGMDFWYEGGMNTFLFQNGGSFYTKDGKKSALDSMESINAFKQFTELYNIYQIPYEANFYTRFRAGQMPIGISSFNTYLQITSAAPELQGKWDVALIPGTKKADGSIDHSNNISSTSAMIFKSCKNVKEAWKFLTWYTSKSTQLRYASDLVSYIGPEAKWASANIEAFDEMSWENSVKKVLIEQRKESRGMPSVVGGYITARHLENARVRTVLQGVNYRSSIEMAAQDITAELVIKNQEFAERMKSGK